MDKDKLIKKEMNKLNKIFKDIAPNKKSLCDNLIKNAAFMAVTLQELQERINEEGAVIEGVNGNGFQMVQESAASKSYNTMINRYTTVIRSLQELLPDSKTDTVNKAGESLAAFIAKGKPGA